MSAPGHPEKPSPGSIIGGKYRLDEQIGRGGMATVWRATHVALGRPVAVKFLSLGGPDRVQLEARFLREARLAAAVRHRHLCDILDFGTTDAGVPFMVMELLQGESLADRLGEGRALRVAETVQVISHALAGLAAVHEAGIVHRDVKPENIFLATDPDGFEVKLFDFGISRSDGTTPELQSAVPTRDNLVVGTPQYMSPEQARGLRDVDYRTDIYSFGVVLYELLSGCLPFDSENPGDVVVMIATKEPTSLLSYRPDLPELAEVVHRALSKRRDVRYGTAIEMRDALRDAFARHTERRSKQERGVGAGEEEPTRPGGQTQPAGSDPSAGRASMPGRAGARDASSEDETSPGPRDVHAAAGSAEGAPGADSERDGTHDEPVPTTRPPPPLQRRPVQAAVAAAILLVATALALAIWAEPDAEVPAMGAGPNGATTAERAGEASNESTAGTAQGTTGREASRPAEAPDAGADRVGDVRAEPSERPDPTRTASEEGAEPEQAQPSGSAGDASHAPRRTRRRRPSKRSPTGLFRDPGF
jgi:serine/threonine-protein kinase